MYSKTPLRVVTKTVRAEEGVAAGAREGLDEEGRVLAVEVAGVTLVNVYTPNSGQGLPRLEARTATWDPAFRRAVTDLAATRPVVVMGDLNVAFRDMDIHNPKSNRNKSAGFCDGERDGMADLLAAGFTDVWLAKNPTVAQYTYVWLVWSALHAPHSRRLTPPTRRTLQVLGHATIWPAVRKQGLAP